MKQRTSFFFLLFLWFVTMSIALRMSCPIRQPCLRCWDEPTAWHIVRSVIQIVCFSFYMCRCQSVSACLPAASFSPLTGPSLPQTEHSLLRKRISVFCSPFSECPWVPPSTKQIMSCVPQQPLLPPLHSYLPLIPLFPAKQSTTISFYHSTLKHTWQQGISKPNQARTESHLQLSKTCNFQTNAHCLLLLSHQHNFILKYWRPPIKESIITWPNSITIRKDCVIQTSRGTSPLICRNPFN